MTNTFWDKNRVSKPEEHCMNLNAYMYQDMVHPECNGQWELFDLFCEYQLDPDFADTCT
jgi:hypothetical protein